MNSIRCCIACILPCGALDVVRIVHSNGHVDEISGSIVAAEIMKAHPKHFLKIPSSPSQDGMIPKIVVVPPHATLQRGKIYFLLPVPPATTPQKSSSTTVNKRSRNPTASNSHSRCQHRRSRSTSNANNNNTVSVENLSTTDRRDRVRVWIPHLESISETPNDDDCPPTTMCHN
ncbi:hypothetical protein like AT1G29195 [Hibiscus trionum]|uniref:Uncharacterized protein n=1 Tax=Hibiscus trionum TaxID=183268 RepID=A0A9W7HRL6_HIBTR|nr:hypothetical protein like AT1G29195 [Hibiscus trionum]